MFKVARRASVLNTMGTTNVFKQKDSVFSLGCFLHLVYFARTTHDKRLFTQNKTPEIIVSSIINDLYFFSYYMFI